MAKQKTNWRWVDWLYVFTIVSQLIYIGYYLEQMLTNPKDNGTLSFAVLQVVAGLVIATLAPMSRIRT